MDESNPYQSPKADTPSRDAGMRSRDLVLAGLAQIVGSAIVAGIILGFHVGHETVALVVGATLGSGVAAWLYHRRNLNRAPGSVKMQTGVVLAVLCVIMAALIQAIWGWMAYPEIEIPIASVGTFVFPFVLFETMRNAVAKKS